MTHERRLSYPGSAILVIAAVFIIAMVCREANVIVAPLLLAIVFAMTASPIVDRIARLGVGRGIGIVVVMLGLTLLVAIIALMVAGSFAELSAEIGGIKGRFEENFPALKQELNAIGITLPKGDPDSLISGDAAGAVIETVLGGLGTLAGAMFLFLFASIFMLIEIPKLAIATAEIETKTGRSFAPMQRLVQDVRHYMGLKTLTSLATAILMMIWLAILGVPYVIIWGLLTFLCYFIPNIGIAIPATAAAIIGLAENGLLNGILAGVGFGVVSTLMNNVLEPRIFGRGLGLAMSIVFVSLIIWGWLFGPIGMLLAVPLTMMVKRLLEASESTIWLARLLGKLDEESLKMQDLTQPAREVEK